VVRYNEFKVIIEWMIFGPLGRRTFLGKQNNGGVRIGFRLTVQELEAKNCSMLHYGPRAETFTPASPEVCAFEGQNC